MACKPGPPVLPGPGWVVEVVGGGRFRGPLPRWDSMLWGPLSEPSSRGGADPVTQGPRGLSYDPPDPSCGILTSESISDAAVFGDGSLKR